MLGALAARGVIEDRCLALRSLGAGAALAAAALAFLSCRRGSPTRDVDASRQRREPAAALGSPEGARPRRPARSTRCWPRPTPASELDDRAGTEAALQEAIRLEPWNYEPYLRLGHLPQFGWGNAVGASNPLVKAYDLSGGQPSIIPSSTTPIAQLGLPPWG